MLSRHSSETRRCGLFCQRRLSLLFSSGFPSTFTGNPRRNVSIQFAPYLLMPAGAERRLKCGSVRDGGKRKPVLARIRAGEREEAARTGELPPEGRVEAEPGREGVPGEAEEATSELEESTPSLADEGGAASLETGRGQEESDRPEARGRKVRRRMRSMAYKRMNIWAVCIG